tara:strand:- start:160 stop:1488 length:1329 start_codon:yes stop_codon:yes gene_type:complete
MTNQSGQTYVAWCWKAGGSKGTFNIDDVGYANASDVGMAVGDQNSSAYDQSQTWSTSGTISNFTTSGTYDFAHLFNGVLGTNTPGTDNEMTSPSSGSGTWTYTINNVTDFKIRLYVPGGPHATANSIKINGSDIVQSQILDKSLSTDTWHTVTVPGITIFTSLFVEDNYWYISNIYVNGKELVDSGVSVNNVPSVAPTGCSVGTKQGFSIIKYDGAGTSTSATPSTIPHGLSQAPSFFIVKAISGDNAADDWFCYHQNLGAYKRIRLNLTNAADTQSNLWGNGTAPTSSVISINKGWYSANYTGHTHILYAWHDVPGLQKFGTYTGGGSSYPFVELGFRPAVIWIKDASTGGNHYDWTVNDSTRNPFNLGADNANSKNTLFLNLNESEDKGSSPWQQIDFLSNGFRMNDSSASVNTDGSTYIYCAWAEAPSFNLYGGSSNGF